MVHANVRRLVLQSLGTTSPECGICPEPFAHADATVMECCHVTCKGCFGRLRKRECPFCRHKFAAPQRTPRETNLRRQGDDMLATIRRLATEVNSLERERNVLRTDVSGLNDEVDSLVLELASLRQRLGNPQPVSHIGRDPVYVPTDPTYSPATPRFSPDPPPAEWEPRATTPVAPQPPTRTAARVLFPDEPDLIDLFGSDSESESDSDVEIREVVQRSEPVPRRRGPCRCTLCGELGHQRNNRRFHPTN